VLTLPPFESTGLLPAGVHPATWPLFVERFGTSAYRREQLVKLEVALRLLRNAGCTRVFVGGSFVTAKSEPNDVDVAWDVGGVDAARWIRSSWSSRVSVPRRNVGSAASFSRHNSSKGLPVDCFSGSSSTHAMMNRSELWSST
jgi:hypothetical protein